MNRLLAILGVLALVAPALAMPSFPANPISAAVHARKPKARREHAALHLTDFFSRGWSERFETEVDHSRAPRLSLFKARQGFLEKIVLAKYARVEGLEKRSIAEFTDELEFRTAFNRRLGVAIDGIQTHREAVTPLGRTGDATRFAGGLRLALIDTPSSAWAIEPRFVERSRNLGDDSAFSVALAGFQDFSDWGLHRLGAYLTIEYDDHLGAIATPPALFPDVQTTRAMRYGLSLAKSFDADLESLEFSIFVEGVAQHQLDGTRQGKTDVTLTPGFRISPLRDDRTFVQFGYEFPISDERSRDQGYLIQVQRLF